MSLVEIDIKANDDTTPGFASVIAKVAALRAMTKDITIGVRFDASQFGPLLNNIGRMEVYSHQAAHALEDINIAVAAFSQTAKNSAGNTGAASGALGFMAGAAGRGAFAFGALSQRVSLFGGVFDKVLPAWLAGASYLHLVVEGVIELASILIPAAVAFAAFGIAAIPTITDIKDQMTNLNIVSQATGQALYPLTGTFTRIADAVKPQVMQLFGDALVIAGQRSGVFQQLAMGAGHALDILGARFTVAMTSGNGLNGVMRFAVSDLAKLGDVVASLGGALGNVFRVVPGYAQILLNLAVAGSHVIEWATSAGAPILKWGLIAHGAFLYAGLAATGFARIMPAIIVGVGNLVANLGATGGRLASMGGNFEKAAAGMRGFGVAAAGASALPWGWIAIVAAGIGVIVYEMLTAKSATQQWIASLEQGIQAGNVIQGMTRLMSAQNQVAAQLSITHKELGTQFGNLNRVVGQARPNFGNANQAMVQQITKGQQLQQGLRILQDQTNLYNYRVNQLAKSYGGWAGATGMLVAAGVPMSLMLKKDAESLAMIHAMVLATSNAYRAMGQTGGVLGADMAVLNRLVSTQYTDMQKLDQAWQTFIQLGTAVETNFTTMIQQMRQVDGEAKAAKTSFTGISNSSILLRQNFATLLNTTQQVVAQLRDAKAPSHVLAQEIGTTLQAAVKAGALQNSVYRQTIYDMAREAGYSGANSIQALTRWINTNATSVKNVSTQTDRYGQSLNKLPASKHTTITSNAPSQTTAVNNYTSALSRIPASKSTTIFLNYVTPPHHAYGGVIGAASGGARGGEVLVGEQGPELVRLPTGSSVSSNADTQNRMMQMGAMAGGSHQLEVVGGHSEFEQFMAKFIRNYVRIRGGNVQQVLGWGSR
jgi:low affinity Fe/Cu permease